MKILSIEPTPSPNAMKLNMDEKIPGGVMRTYTMENKDKAPDYIQKLLEIEGVKSIFHTADFISLIVILKEIGKRFLLKPEKHSVKM